ncbi:MAG: hypothetical protein AAGJ35_13530, partial [Myxococcota bacterium]
MCLQMSCQNVRPFPGDGAGGSVSQSEAAIAATVAAGLPYGGLPGMGMLGGGVGGLGASSNMEHLIQQQALFQRMQLEQLQKQQHFQANELVRRAMATQVSASATQAQLKAMTDALLGSAAGAGNASGVGGGGPDASQPPEGGQSSLLPGVSPNQQKPIGQLASALATPHIPQPNIPLPDNNLYAQLLNAKASQMASQMSAKPLLMAMQNGLLGRGLGAGFGPPGGVGPPGNLNPLGSHQGANDPAATPNPAKQLDDNTNTTTAPAT